VRREYRKAGASCPLQRAGGRGGHYAALTQMLAEMN
jgi:hypothetical protein